MAVDRIGSQFPTQSIILPFKRSKGAEAVQAFEESGKVAQDWQKLLI